MGQIDRYTIKSELARGGMGIVYHAHDPFLGRDVAVKVLLGDGLDTEDLLRFRTEAEAAAAIKHPNVVPIHAFGKTERGPFIVMDLVSGPSLDQQLKEGGPFDPRHAAATLEPIARAVHAGHEAGVLHRDLKPANVLVSEQGAPLLTDFGVAKQVDVDSQGLTATGSWVGSPQYMAPEQARGIRGETGPHTDVYGLGATLYTLVTGKAPFSKGSLMLILSKVIMEEPPAPSSLREGLDPDLERIILTCMQKDPAARYPSAEAVADELARYLAGEPIRARAPSLLSRARRAWRRSPALVLGVAVCLVVIAVSVPVTVVAVSRRGGGPDVTPTRPRSTRSPAPAPPSPSPSGVAVETCLELLASEDVPEGELRLVTSPHEREKLKRGIEDETARINDDSDMLNKTRAYRSRGKLRLKLGDAEGAAADFEAALAVAEARGHSTTHTLFNRGLMRFRQGDREGALSDLEACLGAPDAVEALDEEALPAAWMYLGMAREANGRYEAAEAAHTQAITLDASAWEAWMRRGVLRGQRLGEPLLALSDLQFCAEAYLTDDQRDLARRALLRMAGAEIRAPSLMGERVRDFLVLGGKPGDLQQEGVLSRVPETVLKEEPRGAEERRKLAVRIYQRARALVMLGRRDEAMQHLLRGLRHDPLNLRLWYHYGAVLHDCDQAEDALVVFDHAIQVEAGMHYLLQLRRRTLQNESPLPAAGLIAFLRARVLLELGQQERALRDLERILAQNPKMTRPDLRAGALLLRGLVRQARGETEHAAADYDAVLSTGSRAEALSSAARGLREALKLKNEKAIAFLRQAMGQRRTWYFPTPLIRERLKGLGVEVD